MSLFTAIEVKTLIKEYMNRKIKILFPTFLIITIFSFSTSALASLEVVSYKINGKQESAKFNPSVADSKVSIEINANVPVKWNTISLCAVTDSVCNRTTAVKYFTKTDSFSPSVSKDWDGKTSKEVVVSGGDYKIKITIKDESGTENIQDLSPYIITIDSNFSGNISSESSSSVSKNSSSQSQSASPSPASDAPSPGSSGFISTHSSPEELSSPSKAPGRFEVNSGRDRLVYTGTPVAFSGEAVISKSFDSQSIRYIWSFGDGTSAEGKKVSHTYKFTGDYVVVLNASLSDISAVSRANVKVVNPSVIISNASSDSVEVWNKGIFEINLNGWLISNDRGKFIFPTDTIIAPNKKIAFPDEYMKLNLMEGGKVSLLNPSQKEISVFAGITGGSSSSPTLAVNSSNLDNDPVVMKIRDFIAKANKASLENNNKIVANKPPAKTEDKLSVKKEKDLTTDDDKTVSSSTQAAAVISSSNKNSRQGGFIKSIFSLPSSGLGFIVKKFYSGN